MLSLSPSPSTVGPAPGGAGGGLRGPSSLPLMPPGAPLGQCAACWRALGFPSPGAPPPCPPVSPPPAPPALPSPPAHTPPCPPASPPPAPPCPPLPWLPGPLTSPSEPLSLLPARWAAAWPALPETLSHRRMQAHGSGAPAATPGPGNTTDAPGSAPSPAPPGSLGPPLPRLLGSVRRAAHGQSPASTSASALPGAGRVEGPRAGGPASLPPPTPVTAAFLEGLLSPCPDPPPSFWHPLHHHPSPPRLPPQTSSPTPGTPPPGTPSLLSRRCFSLPPTPGDGLSEPRPPPDAP